MALDERQNLFPLNIFGMIHDMTNIVKFTDVGIF